MVEEGLAELVSSFFMARCDEIRQDYRQNVLEALACDDPVLRDGGPLRIDRVSWRKLSAQERHLLYAYGYVIAEGIGIESLRELDREEIEQRAEKILESMRRSGSSPRLGHPPERSCNMRYTLQEGERDG